MTSANIAQDRGGRPRCLSAEEIAAIQAERKEGAPLKVLADKYDCSRITIWRVLKQKT